MVSNKPHPYVMTFADYAKSERLVVLSRDDAAELLSAIEAIDYYRAPSALEFAGDTSKQTEVQIIQAQLDFAQAKEKKLKRAQEVIAKFRASVQDQRR